MLDFITPIFQLIDKIIPDPKLADEIKLRTLQLQQNGELENLKMQMGGILAEAQSQDKWTSRARPAFLYVVYIMILSSIPMGFIFAINPVLAQNVVSGMQQWLAAIPQAMWDLFGVGYLGYVVGRSWDKTQLLKNSR